MGRGCCHDGGCVGLEYTGQRSANVAQRIWASAERSEDPCVYVCMCVFVVVVVVVVVVEIQY